MGSDRLFVTADKTNSAGSNYKITIGANSKIQSLENYLGRLISNFKSTHYYLYGEGCDRNEAKKGVSNPRRQYSTIIYSEHKEAKRFFQAFIPMAD